MNTHNVYSQNVESDLSLNVAAGKVPLSLNVAAGKVLAIALFFHIISTMYTYNKGETLEKMNINNYFDIIHHNFKDYSQYHHLKNLLTLFIFIPLIIYHSPYKLNGVFSDLLKILPIIIIVRSILTSATIFPSVRKEEIPKTHYFLDYFIGDNHDRMFSGHVSFAILISYLLLKWNYTNSLNLLIIFNLIHAFIIVVTRSHYTIDVLNSAIITLLFCKILL